MATAFRQQCQVTSSFRMSSGSRANLSVQLTALFPNDRDGIDGSSAMALGSRTRTTACRRRRFSLSPRRARAATTDRPAAHQHRRQRGAFGRNHALIHLGPWLGSIAEPRSVCGEWVVYPGSRHIGIGGDAVTRVGQSVLAAPDSAMNVTCSSEPVFYDTTFREGPVRVMSTPLFHTTNAAAQGCKAFGSLQVATPLGDDHHVLSALRDILAGFGGAEILLLMGGVWVLRRRDGRMDENAIPTGVAA